MERIPSETVLFMTGLHPGPLTGPALEMQAQAGQLSYPLIAERVVDVLHVILALVAVLKEHAAVIRISPSLPLSVPHVQLHVGVYVQGVRSWPACSALQILDLLYLTALVHLQILPLQIGTREGGLVDGTALRSSSTYRIDALCYHA